MLHLAQLKHNARGPYPTHFGPINGQQWTTRALNLEAIESESWPPKPSRGRPAIGSRLLELESLPCSNHFYCLQKWKHKHHWRYTMHHLDLSEVKTIYLLHETDSGASHPCPPQPQLWEVSMAKSCCVGVNSCNIYRRMRCCHGVKVFFWIEEEPMRRRDSEGEISWPALWRIDTTGGCLQLIQKKRETNSQRNEENPPEPITHQAARASPLAR